MEKRTRAYRRYKKWIKFKKRTEKWTTGTYSWKPELREEWRKKILEGKSCTWLRTTGNPCNCYSCSEENKYRKDRGKIKREVLKEVLEQIEEELNN